MIYLCIKDKQAIVIEANGLDDAYMKAGPLFGIVAKEPENIDLDVCKECPLGYAVDISDAFPDEDDEDA